MRALYDLTLAAAVLIGAIGGSQVPRFVQEYEQRLGGAFQEASRQLAEYRRVADESRLPFPAYVQRLTTSPDAVGRRRRAGPSLRSTPGPPTSTPRSRLSSAHHGS